MDELEFVGKVVNGIGKHSQLVVPGRKLLPGAPSNWPERLFPGSLNVLISQYPEEFSTRSLELTTRALDIAGFEPAFTIPQACMTNNELAASEAMPHRGVAQIWRANLTVSERETRCWVLRRFGSGLSDQIELVSGVGLRNELGLSPERTWPAVVKLAGWWNG